MVVLRRWPIVYYHLDEQDGSTVLDNQFWEAMPKAFVSNRVRKIAGDNDEVGITWRHCPADMNLADLTSRGAPM